MTASAPFETPAGPSPAAQGRRRAALIGLGVSVVLVVAAFVVPPLTGWDVHARKTHPDRAIPPLHGWWEPRAGVAVVMAAALAVVGWRWAGEIAGRLPWRRMMLVAYVAGLAWLLSLALMDGSAGLSRVLGADGEYLQTARSVDSLPVLLQSYIDRIPYAHDDNWPTHVAGHPPGMLLFFVLLVKVGLGGDLAAGVVVAVVAATIPLAMMTLLRALGAESTARTVAPFLVFTPAAIFMAVSADAVMAALVAWGMCCLALAGAAGLRRGWPWAILAGLLLGYAVMTSYGLPLTGVIALTVLWLARAWWALPVAIVSALAVVLAFAGAGFAWWDAYPVLVERYWDGIASERPGAYWMWGNLAALVVAAGPMVAAGLGATAASWRSRSDRVVFALVAAAAVVVIAADLSQMSRSEVERIWLPFVPWLTLGCALLPAGWRRPALGVQMLAAVAIELLLYTSW